MTNYLIRRFFQMILVVFLSTIAIYVLLNIAPGGPLSGIRLAGNREDRVSDVDIARLESYLGLDKPLALRYISWLIGDDWLGANWMYVGVAPYKQVVLGRDGQPRTRIDSETRERVVEYASFRFWADPGVASLNPGYRLFVYGEVGEEGIVVADRVRVKVPTSESVSEDVAASGAVYEQVGYEIVLEDLNEDRITVIAHSDTIWEFLAGEAPLVPTEGTWTNISWLTGPGGILGRFAPFHGDGHGMLRLDFGESWATRTPVINRIKDRLSNTLILMSSAVIVSLVVAIPIGIYSAVNQYSVADYIVTTFAFFGSAMPVFWFGLMMILIFTIQFHNWGLPFLPSGGVQMVRSASEGSVLAVFSTEPGSFVDRVVHLIMPVIVLSLLYMAGWSRFMRTSMLEVLRQDYVRTARAKGLMERVVLVKHAVRNALIPIVTIIVFQIPGIFGGAILTETIFSYPGMGRLYFEALGGSDWPLVMAILFISSVLVVVATLVRDVLYTVVDPRIRFS